MEYLYKIKKVFLLLSTAGRLTTYPMERQPLPIADCDTENVLLMRCCTDIEVISVM